MRCAVLLHLVDGAPGNVVRAWRVIREELAAYGGGLEDKAEIVALSKTDAVDAGTLKQQLARLKRAAKRTPMQISEIGRASCRERV